MSSKDPNVYGKESTKPPADIDEGVIAGTNIDDPEHPDIITADDLGDFDANNLDLIGNTMPWIYHPFYPSPLYLNHSVVFEKFSKLAGAWQKLMPENYDPLRPRIGHWRKLVGPFLGNTTPPEILSLQKIWFDTTNNLKSPINSDYYDFTKPGSRIFVRPYMYSWPEGESSYGKIDHPMGWTPDSDIEWNKGFRFLATNLVQIQSTETTEKWESASVLVAYALAGGPYEGDLQTLIAETINDAANYGPLPHSHTGYIDKNGVGFTVSMDILPKYLGLYEIILTLGEDIQRKAIPMYHTHTLTNFGVGNFSHENNQSYEYSGLYSKEPEGEQDILMSLGNHPSNYLIAGDVDTSLFLEFMHLYYNNKELENIVRLTEQDVGSGLTWDAYETEKSGQPLFLGEITKDVHPEAPTPVGLPQVYEKYFYKRQKLKKHFLDTYIKHMHKPSIGYKNIASYKIFQDKVFNPRTLKNQMSLGFRESIFNHIPPLYEDAINLLPGGQHKLIPNSYLFGQFEEDKERFSPTAGKYGNLFLLGHPVKNKESVFGHTVDSYLYNWSQMIIKENYVILDPSSTPTYGFPKYDFIAKYNSIGHTMPWSARLIINTPAPLKQSSIEFPDKRGTFINDTFIGLYHDDSIKTKKDELMLFFMARVADKNPSTSFSTGDQYYKQDFYIRDINNLEKKEIETFNFTDFTIGTYQDTQEFDPTSNELLSFDPGTKEKWGQTTGHNIENAFIEFKDKIEEFQNTRSVYEVLDAANTHDMEKHGYTMHPFAHNEIMFYEIEKWTGDPGTNSKLIQKYFIAPPDVRAGDTGVIEFIDSQIKLDKGYYYNVNVYVLVVGNKYQYTDIQTRGFKLIEQKTGEDEVIIGAAGEGSVNISEIAAASLEDFKYYISAEHRAMAGSTVFAPVADIFVLNRPNIELLKIPYTSFQTLYITNKPPLHPSVVIYPYKNVNNNLLFTFSQLAGEKTEKPIEILPGDKEIFMKAAYAQEKIDADDLELPSRIEFASDEPDLRYQVFRIEEHPSSWSDFAMALRKPVLLPDGSYRELQQHEKDFVESLSPNKKYYYAFRTIDPKGYISNPSPIYEVELVDDSGAVYLITKIITFKPKVPKEMTKSMRKYIHIAPTLKQSNLQAPPGQSIYAVEGLDSDVHLGDLFGVEEDPRRFKIRFTSKSSGKKFDLNLNFVHKHKGVIQVLSEDPGQTGEKETTTPTSAADKGDTGPTGDVGFDF